MCTSINYTVQTFSFHVLAVRLQWWQRARCRNGSTRFSLAHRLTGRSRYNTPLLNKQVYLRNSDYTPSLSFLAFLFFSYFSYFSFLISLAASAFRVLDSSWRKDKNPSALKTGVRIAALGKTIGGSPHRGKEKPPQKQLMHAAAASCSGFSGRFKLGRSTASQDTLMTCDIISYQSLGTPSLGDCFPSLLPSFLFRFFGRHPPSDPPATPVFCGLHTCNRLSRPF
ncbi:hypothetical protein HD806DRAFT_365901 [Xylariaceae sp. AK1471]|nr:hypothetical protein HD806DRAFT_365901 [Xylariaceae sp. AK1471]